MIFATCHKLLAIFTSYNSESDYSFIGGYS